MVSSLRPICLAVLLSCACVAPAQADVAPLAPLVIPAPEPVLTVAATGRTTQVFPRDIADIEISESGGITDIFVRLEPEATDTLSRMTDAAMGLPLSVRVCDVLMLEAVVQAQITSGTLYLADTTAVRAEALRALWHGRSTCTDLDPEIFSLGQ